MTFTEGGLENNVGKKRIKKKHMERRREFFTKYHVTSDKVHNMAVI